MPERLPARLQPWLPAAYQSSHRWGVNVCLILGVLDRESHGGKTLKPEGPAGTGDWQPRRWSKYAHREDAQRFKHWVPSRDEWCRWFPSRTRLWPAEVCMPGDGQGFGRGLMQLDFADTDNDAFLSEMLPGGIPAWQDGTRNIDAGTKKLVHLIEVFGHDEALAAAAYNAGVGAVREAQASITGPVSIERLQRAVDQVTTGKNYCTDVIGRRDRFCRLFVRHCASFVF